jgi:mRNA interferase RelE/StbE
VNLQFRGSFARDLRSIGDKSILSQVKELIVLIEQAKSPQDLSHLKKIKGSTLSYRIRLGEYRVGLTMEEDTVTMVRVLHRRDISRHFP